MKMRTTGQILSEEHQNILKVIGALKRETSKIEDGAALDEKFFYSAVDFIRNYADAFHHAKEEGILFRELTRQPGFPHGPVHVMLHEHELGRSYVKALDQALKIKDTDGVLKSSSDYAGLLEQHIHKEDTILFPMADRALDDRLQVSMVREFADVEKKFTQIGKYLAISSEFEARR
jgi:hemerythrin-like domain-containing protein